MSEIITNKLTGKTAAGNVTITSEGGSATMQLQNGLVKSYLVYDFTDDTTSDSSNISSVTDRATGSLYGTYTNNMSILRYATTCAVSPVDPGTMTTSNSNRYGIVSGDTTARFSANYYQVTTSNDPQDDEYTATLVVGDLA